MQRSYNLADLFEIAARAVPDRIAVIQGERQFTYADLDARADRLACYLQSQGIGRGDVVGLQMYNGSEYLEGFLAACKLCAIPANINYRYVADELVQLYTNARLAALIYSHPLDAVVTAALAQTPPMRAILATGDAYERVIDETPARYDVPERGDEDIALLYTGGTTGLPKGVMWPHRALFFGCLGGGDFYRRSGQPISAPEQLADIARNGYPLRYLALSPLMHGASLWACLVALYAGLTVLLQPGSSFDAIETWNLIERQQVNVASMVGDAHAVPLLDALRQHPGSWNLDHLMNLGSGGGLLSEHVQQELGALLPNAGVTNSIGTSEGGYIGGGGRPRAGAGFIEIAARPELMVMAQDLTRVAAPDEIGLLVRCGDVPVGYFGDPEKSAQTFFEYDGRHCANTGDLARRTEHGSIVVLGRGSQCINTGGEKVFPEEVEEVIRMHPSVRDVLVVGVSDPRWGESVNAVVSLYSGETLVSDAIRAHCKQHLADYKAPKTVVSVDTIERSPAGKGDYRWARRQFDGLAS